MRAMQVDRWCEPGDLELVELPGREPGPGDVRIDVKAIGVNLADILMVQGKYQIKPPFPFAPGSEVAGVVRSVGAEVSEFRVGQRVLALLPYGAYASEVIAPADRVYLLPEGMPLEHAAALTVVYHTSYFALAVRAPVSPGQTVLVHGAAGGVGLAAVQIAKALGARVLATAGSADKRAFVLSQGAEAAFDSRDPEWVQAVLQATDGRGADHIYDPVGGDIFDLSLKCIAFEGNLHVIGFASGRIPTCAMNRVLLKNISLVGLHWGPYQDKQPEAVRSAMQALFAMYAKGQLALEVSATYPLEQAAEALAQISSRKAQGKIVLTV
jgi:NADPH2:quinone reductase